MFSMRCLFFHPSFYHHISSKLSSWRLVSFMDMSSKSATQPIDVKEKKYVYRQRWQTHEHLVLIEAKEKQEKELEQVGKEILQKTSKEKWQEIAAYCHNNGINRTGTQCRDKWHKLMLVFSKVKNWESSRPPGKESFWKMNLEERNAEGLCFKLDKQIFSALDGMGNSTCAPTAISSKKLDSIMQQEAKSVYDQSITLGKPHQHDLQEKESELGSTETSSNVQQCSDAHIGKRVYEDCMTNKNFTSNVHQSSDKFVTSNTKVTPEEDESTTIDVHIGLVHEDNLINRNNSNIHHISTRIDTSNCQIYPEEERTMSDAHIGQPKRPYVLINKDIPANVTQISSRINTCNTQIILDEKSDPCSKKIDVDDQIECSYDERDAMVQLDHSTPELEIKDCNKGLDHKGIAASGTIQHINDALHDDRPPLIVSIISKCLNDLKGTE